MQPKHILSIKPFSRQEIEKIFEISEELEPIAFGKRKLDLLKDKIMAVLFFQPSTRTRLSFETAMQRMGGSVIGFADPEQSRAGGQTQETLKDTARVIQGYADVVVIRHHIDFAAREFSEHSTIPVINGGDGFNEHPTQAILDLYTIKKELGRIDNTNVLIWGHMGLRAFHSLCFALAKFKGVTVYLYSPEELRTPAPIKQEYETLGLNYREIDDVENIMGQIDVFYVAQVRRGKAFETEKKYILNAERLKRAKKEAIVLHPLPRTDELPEEVDGMPCAKYFIQSDYGVVTRMALLKHLFLGR